MKTLLRGGQPQDREKALEILAALEKLLPKDPELMKFRALQMLEDSPQQSRETARGLLEKVVKLEPTALDAHRVLISMAMQDGDYETARDCAIRALGSNPESLALLSARGRAEFALGNTQMAAELAKLAIQKDPNNVAARNLIVAAALKSEDSALLEMATESARRALQEDPNNAKARDAIVAVALKTKDETILEEARELIESALDANSADEELLISRARVMVALKQPEIAIPELNAYCQTEEGSNSIPALVTLADLYRLSGDMDQAEQRIVQAEKLNPNSQTVVHARFVWLVAQKRYNELAEISSEYISAEEQNPTTLVKAASALAALDSMELKKEGIKLFEHVLTLSPKLFNARMGLAATLYEAATLYQKGDAERAKMINRAKKINEELLKEAPSNIRILNDLAWILQDHYDRYDAALELANKGLMFAPDELHLLDTRGTILSNLPDRLADAKKDFERLKELSQPDTRQRAKALLQLGRICSKLNDLVQAKQHLQKALEIDRKIDVFTSDERSEITRIIQ